MQECQGVDGGSKSNQMHRVSPPKAASKEVRAKTPTSEDPVIDVRAPRIKASCFFIDCVAEGFCFFL